MNVVYMHTHDSGRFLQPYGYGVPAPNLMKFTENATLFRKAFCAGPTCSPSRAALLSGQSPHVCGQLGLAHRGFHMKDYSRHLASYLRTEGGFETVLCGIQHEAPCAEMIGYSRILGDQNYNMGDIGFDGVSWDKSNAAAAAEYILEKHEKPFFLSYGLFCTHRKYPKHDASVNPDYVMPPPVVADTRENREDFADYVYSAGIADECMGVVLDAVRESGHSNDTMIIVTTDHGPAFPFMKCNLYDGGIGVTLIVDYPGNRKRGQCVDSLVSHLDLYSTICDYCNVPVPDETEGFSILPLLENKCDAVRTEVFSEVNFHACYEPMRCIRNDHYKLIRRFDDDLSIVASNIDDSPGKRCLIKDGLLGQTHARIELYDLLSDPMEEKNLAGDVKYHDIMEEMNLKLESWMKRTDDPILKGCLKAPRGCLLNYRTSINAEEELYRVE